MKKDPISDGEVEAMKKGLDTILNSFETLAIFKHHHSKIIIILKEMPIDESQVSTLQGKMPRFVGTQQ